MDAQCPLISMSMTSLVSKSTTSLRMIHHLYVDLSINHVRPGSFIEDILDLLWMFPNTASPNTDVGNGVVLMSIRTFAAPLLTHTLQCKMRRVSGLLDLRRVGVS